MHYGGHNRSEKKTKETIEKSKAADFWSFRHHHKSSMGNKRIIYMGIKGN
jgi:hypothetical protein